MLRLNEQVYDAIRRHGEETYPYECCGVLLGRTVDGTNEVEEAVPDKNSPIVAYCGSGTRSLLAGRILKELGYTNVVSMQGGFTAWKNRGLPVREDRQFTAVFATGRQR